MPFNLRSPEQPLDQDSLHDHTAHQQKSKQLLKDTDTDTDTDKDKDTNKDQSKETAQDSMAPKSGYYESSRSSSEGDRVHYDPRKERRAASKTSTTKRPVEIHHHYTSSGEPKRASQIDHNKWK